LSCENLEIIFNEKAMDANSLSRVSHWPSPHLMVRFKGLKLLDQEACWQISD
jgi:hypothetical protein